MSFSQLALHLLSLWDQATLPPDDPNYVACEDPVWQVPQNDGSVIFPKGCACGDFPVQVFFTDEALAIRMKEKENPALLEPSNSFYSFLNNPRPTNIQFTVPAEDPLAEDDTVTIIRGPGEAECGECSVERI